LEELLVLHFKLFIWLGTTLVTCGIIFASFFASFLLILICYLIFLIKFWWKCQYFLYC